MKSSSRVIYVETNTKKLVSMKSLENKTIQQQKVIYFIIKFDEKTNLMLLLSLSFTYIRKQINKVTLKAFCDTITISMVFLGIHVKSTLIFCM